ncbi:MAG: hypothetical protein KDK91_13980 [Gammaproteobacteria bacterium]|nr:hypothetical protein [Gammaproteobacteria bacterium]
MTDPTNRYHWIVTRDTVLGDSSDAIGKIGPRGARERPRFDDLIIRGVHFRLLNDDGEVQFTGYILGEFDGAEPLRDYGLENGCTRIEYERDGQWVAFDSSARDPGGSAAGSGTNDAGPE